MLGHHLPFDNQDDKEIARMTINDEITFSHSVWLTVDSSAKDLISKLLVKDMTQRITFEEVLLHPWIVRDNEEIFALRRYSVVY